MGEAEIFQKFGLSLLIGLFVGLQREAVASRVAGLRTFPLITLLGSVTALLASTGGSWAIGAGLLATASVLVTSNVIKMRGGDVDPGTTTEFAVLLMYAVGVLAVTGPVAVAVAVGGAVAVLLHLKPQLHEYVHRLGTRDVTAVMKFLVITCIILPVLPNRGFGPLEAFNPFETWLMAVLIVGIGLAGYIGYKLFGENAGIAVSGILGGAVSSTATTVSVSRQHGHERKARTYALVIIVVASCVVYARVLIEVLVTSRAFVAEVVGPVIVLAVLTAIPAVVLLSRSRGSKVELPEPKNPTELVSAFTFAAVYAIIRFALTAAEEYIGGHGLYAVAVVSGLTDMDAVTLSSARMVGEGRIEASVGTDLIVIGVLSNFVFKLGVIFVLGGRAFFSRALLCLLSPMVGGALLLWLGPDSWVQWVRSLFGGA